MGLQHTIARSARSWIEVTPIPSSQERIFKFVGEIDEESNFEDAWAYVAQCGNELRGLVLDLEKVTRINSAGVQGWITFLQRAQARLKCRFATISEVVALQGASVRSVLGRPGTPLEAFHVAYACQSCPNTDSERLIVEELIAWPGFSPPVRPCTQCSGTRVFDDSAEEFEQLLKRYRRGDERR